MTADARTIAVYAPGAGLGHLTRVRAAHHTLTPDARLVLLTDSPFATDHRVVGDAAVHLAPSPPTPTPAGGGRSDGDGSDRGSDYDDGEVGGGSVPVAGRRAWLRRTLCELAPDEVWVDAFPAGLWGEVDAGVLPWPTPRTCHLARLLRWDRYRPALPALPVTYDQVWWVEEPADDDHRRFIEEFSRAADLVDLRHPPATALDADGTEVELAPADAPRWVVVHSGHADETAELVRYAADLAEAESVQPALTLVRPAPTGGADGAVPPEAAGWPGPVAVVDAYSATDLCLTADRVVSAAGWATMHQLAPLRTDGGDRHRFVPLPRRLDDPFTRARRAR